jgi:DNA-binding response OmpR family regulator
MQPVRATPVPSVRVRPGFNRAFHLDFSCRVSGPLGTPLAIKDSTMERTAIVVSADPLARNLAAEILSMREFRVNQGATLDDARRLFAATRHEILVLDLTLDDAAGLTAWQTLLDEAGDRFSEAILLTSPGSEFVRQTSHEGVCAMLEKPFTISEFLRVVDLCSGDASRDQIA